MIEIPTTLTTTQSQSQTSLQPAALHPATRLGRVTRCHDRRAKFKTEIPRIVCASPRHSHARFSKSSASVPTTRGVRATTGVFWRKRARPAALRISRLLTSPSRDRESSLSRSFFVTFDNAMRAEIHEISHFSSSICTQLNVRSVLRFVRQLV